MKLQNKTNTKAAVTYHACTCTYNTVLAQYTDLALTASTLSEKCSTL